MPCCFVVASIQRYAQETRCHESRDGGRHENDADRCSRETQQGMSIGRVEFD